MRSPEKRKKSDQKQKKKKGGIKKTTASGNAERKLSARFCSKDSKGTTSSKGKSDKLRKKDSFISPRVCQIPVHQKKECSEGIKVMGQE